jgi:hypothetical protein
MTLSSQYLTLIEQELGPSWLPKLYRERVLKTRTRSYQFPPGAGTARVEIHHTLLGIELKAGRRRMLCPDLATARYLSVFARLGCENVAIPYDITKISLVADELESSWHRMLLISDRLSAPRGKAFQTRVRRQIIAKVRNEVNQAGAGPRVPEFKQNTKPRDEAANSTKRTKDNLTI